MNTMYSFNKKPSIKIANEVAINRLLIFFYL
jgi:hypothetical protein